MKLSHAEQLESWIFVSISGPTSGLAGSGPVAWLWRKTEMVRGQRGRRTRSECSPEAKAGSAVMSSGSRYCRPWDGLGSGRPLEP